MSDQAATPVYSDWIVLDEPIQRGETSIDKIRLRKPRSGELRGLSITGLTQANVDQITQLLPRIAEPHLIAADIAAMDPADLAACAGEVVGFLLPRAMKARLLQEE